MERKKLLVLGASYSQIPLFQAAGRIGVETYAVTIPGPWQGIPHADHVVYADITKPEEVLDAVKDLGASGVTTCCMDVGTRTLGHVCEALSLPGPRLMAAEAARDKSLQKKVYRESGIPTAPFRIVRNLQELEEAAGQIGFPAMVKAVDLMGSRGVFRADSLEEARLYFQSAMEESEKSYCIVEKFLQGTMFGVEGMTDAEGKLVYMLPLGNDLHDGNPPFPQGHHVPWNCGGDVEAKIRDMVEKTVPALGFYSCAFDMDCMLADGACYVIEATPRCGATGIADTVSLYYGIDYFEAIVRCALGEDVRWMFGAKDGKGCANASWLISAPADGVVSSIEIPDSLPEQVTDLTFNVKPGDQVHKMRNGRDRIGQLIVKGDDPDECRRLIRKLLGEIRINVM